MKWGSLVVCALLAILPNRASAQKTFGTLVVVETEPTPAGPSPLSAESPAQWRFVELVYAPLFQQQPSGTFEPNLASKIEVEDGGKRVVVQLAKSAVWTTGRTVRPADVIYTYALARTGKWNRAYQDLLKPIKQIETHSNGFDVVFSYDRPVKEPRALLTVPLVSNGIHGPLDNPNAQRPRPFGVIGAGPFKLASPQEPTRLVANETAVKRPRLSEIQVITAGSRALAMAYVRVRTNAVTFEANPRDMSLMSSEFGTRTLKSNRRRLFAISFGKKSLLGDPVVHQAFERAISRPALFGPGAAIRPTLAPVPRRSSLYPSNLTPSKRDAVEAEKIMWWSDQWIRDMDQPYFVRVDAKNNKEPASLEFILDSDDPESMRLVRVITQQLREAGIRVVSKPRPRFEFLNQLKSGAFSAALVNVPLPPSNNLRPLFHSRGGKNVFHVASNMIDKLLDSGQTRVAIQHLINLKRVVFLGTQQLSGAASSTVFPGTIGGHGGLSYIRKWQVR